MPQYRVQITPEKLKGRDRVTCFLAHNKQPVNFSRGEVKTVEMPEWVAEGLALSGYVVEPARAAKASKKEE